MSVNYSVGGGAAVASFDEVRRRLNLGARSVGRSRFSSPTSDRSFVWLSVGLGPLGLGHLISPVECRMPMRLVLWARKGIRGRGGGREVRPRPSTFHCIGVSWLLGR